VSTADRSPNTSTIASTSQTVAIPGHPPTISRYVPAAIARSLERNKEPHMPRDPLYLLVYLIVFLILVFLLLRLIAVI
jgi:hypothetical protein